MYFLYSLLFWAPAPQPLGGLCAVLAEQFCHLSVSLWVSVLYPDYRVFICIKEVRSNIFAPLFLPCSDPQLWQKSGARFKWWQRLVGQRRFLSRDLLHRLFLNQHSWTHMERVKSRKMHIDEVVSCPWLCKIFLLSYHPPERIWTPIRSRCLEMGEARGAALLTARKCVAWLYSAIIVALVFCGYLSSPISHGRD